jgi:hypothetical protein
MNCCISLNVKKTKDEIDSELEQVKKLNPSRQMEEKRWKEKIYVKKFWKFDSEIGIEKIFGAEMDSTGVNDLSYWQIVLKI